MSKKALSAKILLKYFKPISLPILTSIRPKVLYILAYHRIFPFPGKNYPFAESTISATPEEFDKQMEFVRKRFNVINFDTISNAISSGKPLPKKSLIITFDDGYGDNYEIAFEIIRKHKLTATIFLSTYFIDTGKPFWFDKLSYIIKKMPQGPITFGSGKYIFEVTDKNREEIRKSVVKLLRTVTNEERLNLLSQLEQQSKIVVPKDDLELAKPLDWRQIREMSDEGIEIGSHTITHPFLTKLTRDEIIYELAESKKIIEDKTGTQVKSIAYPNGDYNQTVIYCAKECGYEVGISYEHNFIDINKYQPFSLPRIHVELDVTYPLFQANILFPQVFVKYGG